MSRERSGWRIEAERVITEALAEANARELDERAMRKLVSERFPFGERRHLPYKHWLSARALILDGRVVSVDGRKRRTAAVEAESDPRQGSLFGATP